MRVVQIVFPVATLGFCAVSLAGDRDTYRPRVLWRSLRSFLANPTMSKEYRDMVAEYLRPGFHPTDRDTTALTEKWRAELFGTEGTMVRLLPGGSSGPAEPAQFTS
jgi:predicted metal-dependent hydrolase